MQHNELVQLAAAYGWRDLGPQKNTKMLSFKHDERPVRMNVYFTAMTVTFQHEDRRMRSVRDVNDLEQLLTNPPL